jgi:hypothetical protein
MISKLALKVSLLRAGFLNKLFRISESHPRISFVSAWIQLQTVHDVDMNKFHPKRLTQGLKDHFCFSSRVEATFTSCLFKYSLRGSCLALAVTCQ